MPEVSLEDFRKSCENWEEKEGCEEDYPEECPMSKECQRDAEE